MKSVILFWDVAEPIGNVPTGGMVILFGDAPLWKYFKMFYRAIAEGASVVAIGHGIDIDTDASGCMVAYSCEEEYTIGKPISQRVGKKFSASAGTPVAGTNSNLIEIPVLGATSEELPGVL